MSPCSRDVGPPPSAVSEAEFEEIMKRNRAISSSAISKAVAGASAGNLLLPWLLLPLVFQQGQVETLLVIKLTYLEEQCVT